MTAPARLIVILGPTASGKSALAIELAKRLNGEILVCDSTQVYRHFDIGTAKVAPVGAHITGDAAGAPTSGDPAGAGVTDVPAPSHSVNSHSVKMSQHGIAHRLGHGIPRG